VPQFAPLAAHHVGVCRHCQQAQPRRCRSFTLGLLQVEQRLRNVAASGQLKNGSGSYTRGILYDADHVILTKALAANPHDILKALNFGSLPYKPCGTRVSVLLLVHPAAGLVCRPTTSWCAEASRFVRCL
jgi:hypothetical protein